MSRKTEEEFINEGFSEDELASMNDGGTAEPEAPQEPVQAEAAPEASNDTPPVETPPVAEPEPKMVDVRALQEARAELRRRDEEIARVKTEQAQLEARVAAINEAIAKQNQPEPPKVPTLEEDPVEYYNHKIAALEKQLEAMNEGSAKQTAQMAEEQKRLETVSQADAVINAAIAKDPTLQSAIDFAFEGMRKDIAAEMSRRGVPVHQQPQVGQQWMNNMIADLAGKVPRDPELAADFVMRQARFYGFGYQPQQVQQAPQVQQPTIQQRAEQQERHASLSGVQGASAPVTLDAKALASMSDAQYNELLKTLNGRKQLAEVFGGV